VISKRHSNGEYAEQRRKPWRKLYSTKAWKVRRRDQLLLQPLCERCLSRGVITPATVAHHVERHDGDEFKFFHGKLASSCADCHDVDEQRIENGGQPRRDVDDDGWPKTV